MTERVIIFSAPSGAGKTTIVRELLARFPSFSFSVSATSRAPREGERDGVDYYFLTPEKFAEEIKNDAFIEWEEVYPGVRYGTLRGEVDRIVAQGRVPIFDVDVVGGLRLKRIFKNAALSLFIMPPSLEVLRERLTGRGTESAEKIASRLSKAEFEIGKSLEFDRIVVNDRLPEAVDEAEAAIRAFLAEK